MRRLVSLVIVTMAVAASAGIVVARNDGLTPEQQAVKAATARFHSVDQAVAAGYVAASPCESSPFGTMGIHYLNGPLVGDPTVDPLRPEVLLYLPDEAGKLRLVGVEYFKVDADQNTATDGDRPSVLGQPMEGPMAGHAPGMPIHYDRHFWLYASNPDGLFATWNRAISCP